MQSGLHVTARHAVPIASSFLANSKRNSKNSPSLTCAPAIADNAPDKSNLVPNLTPRSAPADGVTMAVVVNEGI